MDRISCTLFRAVFRNPCVLALHPVHTVRPPTGCPVPPGAPSALPGPGWINSCGLCVFISEIRDSGEARGTRRPLAHRQGLRRTMSQVHPRSAPGAGQAGRQPCPFQAERLLLSRRQGTTSPSTSTSRRAWSPSTSRRAWSPSTSRRARSPSTSRRARSPFTSRRAWSPSICPPTGRAAGLRLL
jgi:hypothetical protein